MKQVKKLMIAIVLSISYFSKSLATEFELEPLTVTEESIRPSFNQQTESKNQLRGIELIERGVNNIEEISLRIPNFHLSNEGIGSNGQHFSMRGLTNTSLFSEPAIIFYVDDVPFNGSSATIGQLFTIDKIDVYRSSQPGRFGKNAYAGAVDIKTSQPNNKLSGNVALQLGNYEQYIVTANGSGAIIKDQLYFSLNGQFLQRDGFLFNSYLNNRPDPQEHFSGRALLKWTPNKNWDIRLKLNKEDFDYGASRLIRLDSPRFYTIRSEINETLKQQTDSESLRIAYNNDDYEFLSVSSRQFWQMKPRIVDLDLLPTISTRFQDSTSQAWNQEFRLTPKNKYGNWDWQAGLFYSHIQRYGKSNLLFPNLSYVRIELKDRDIDNYAVFGHIAYNGFESLTTRLDLRMDYIEEKSDARSSYPSRLVIVEKDSRNSFFVSPKFSIDYIISKHLSLYLSTVLMAKPAGFTVSAINSNLFSYKKETAWQNEIGFKSNWFNNLLVINLAGFYYDIDNYQLERFLTVVDYSIVNADKVHSYGFEVEAQLELMDYLWLDAGFGYTYTQIDRYYDAINKINYAGKIAPFIPDFTGIVAVQYKHPEGYFARAEWLLTGRSYFDENNTNLMSQNAYSIGNIRVGYEKERYSIYAFVNNISDTEYYTFKTVSTRGAVGDPRTFGVRLGMSF